MNNYVIDIDVNKEKLDFCLQREKNFRRVYRRKHNNYDKKYFEKSGKKYQFSKSDILLCAEYTGKYIYPLSCACTELSVELWMEDLSQIKHRSGVQRGKNDKSDAHKIATYALRFQNKARLFSFTGKETYFA
jgi:hypothetical protein